MITSIRKSLIKTCLIGLTAAFIFGGCTFNAAVSPTPVDMTTPEIYLPLDPSPTRMLSDLPLSCQFTDLGIYVSRADKYCFAYPERFQLNEQGGDQPLLQGPAAGSTAELRANFKVEISSYDENKSLDQHVDEFLQGFVAIEPSAFEHQRVTIDGEPAILVERASVSENNQPPSPKQMNWRIVFVQHGSSLYRLIYRPADAAEVKADLDELYQTTMGSFAFLEQNLISNTPVITSTPTETPIPPMPVPPTPVPPTSTPSTPCDWMSFVTDVSVPDGSTFAPSTTFVKTWRLKNIGTCTWTPSYSLVFVSGDPMNRPTSVAMPGNVPPGYSIDVSVTLTAPSGVGSYTGNWMLRNATGATFGNGPTAKGTFWVKINVNCTSNGTKVYMDSTGIFCFAYPSRFVLNGPSADQPLLQGPSAGASGGLYASLKIEVVAFDASKSFDQQVDEFLLGFVAINPNYFEHTRLTIAGEPAIRVERARIPQDDGSGGNVQMDWRIIFVEHENRIYRLIYRPANEQAVSADFNDLYQLTTGSFSFLK